MGLICILCPWYELHSPWCLPAPLLLYIIGFQGMPGQKLPVWTSEAQFSLLLQVYQLPDYSLPKISFLLDFCSRLTLLIQGFKSRCTSPFLLFANFITCTGLKHLTVSF